MNSPRMVWTVTSGPAPGDRLGTAVDGTGWPVASPPSRPDVPEPLPLGDAGLLGAVGRGVCASSTPAVRMAAAITTAFTTSALATRFIVPSSSLPRRPAVAARQFFDNPRQ